MSKTVDQSRSVEGPFTDFGSAWFQERVWDRDNCFFCGSPIAPGWSRPQHVLDRWIMGRFELDDVSVNLPNGGQIPYGSYTLPRCVDCANLIGRDFDSPIGSAVDGGFDEISEMIREEGMTQVSKWVALTALKFRLAGHRLQRSADAASEDALEACRHFHLLASALYTGLELDHHAMGSTLVRQMADDGEDAFDMLELPGASTIFLRVGNVAVFGVLDDAGACEPGLSDLLGKIDGPLSPPQAREVAVELAAARLHLRNPPSFTLISDGNSRPALITSVDGRGPQFAPKNHALVGELKVWALQPYIEAVAGNRSTQQLTRLARQNRFSFLFDDNGDFIRGD